MALDSLFISLGSRWVPLFPGVVSQHVFLQFIDKHLRNAISLIGPALAPGISVGQSGQQWGVLMCSTFLGKALTPPPQTLW